MAALPGSLALLGKALEGFFDSGESLGACQHFLGDSQESFGGLQESS